MDIYFFKNNQVVIISRVMFTTNDLESLFILNFSSKELRISN